MLTRNEILRLQFLTSAWRETHPKVRQPFIPGSRYAHLFGAVFGRQLGNGVQTSGGQFGTEEVWRCVRCPSFFYSAFYPNFVDTLLLPVGKQADAVRTRFDSIKVVLQLTQWEIFINVLTHHEGGLNIERDFCNYAKRSESNYHSPEGFAVLLARKLHQIAGCRHEFQRRDRGCKIAILLA